MAYLIIYLLIGITVSILMATLHVWSMSNDTSSADKRVMLDSFLLIALAWPLSIAAFIYGAFSHLLSSTFSGNGHS